MTARLPGVGAVTERSGLSQCRGDSSAASDRLVLCKSADLENGGLAVSFDVWYQGQTCRAFAIRHDSVVHAFLNRCSHVPMEMDYQPDRFFDASGQWLICATHGATYRPATGACVGGPCRGGLVKIGIHECDGVVHWHTADDLKPIGY